MIEVPYDIHRNSTEIQSSVVSNLVSIVEKEISSKNEQLDMYEKRLSTIIRSVENNPNLAENLVLKDLKMPSKKSKKKENGDKDWLKYQGLMLYSGDPKMGEARIYFDTVSTIRDEVFALEEIKKALKNLIASGLGDETRCSIFFKDGIPVKLVLRPADEENHTKISLQTNFRIK